MTRARRPNCFRSPPPAARTRRALFARYRARLKRMVHLRLSRRLQGRVDDSDVLQEAYLDVARRLPEYVRDPKLPFFLWVRHLTGLKLTEIHRRHLGT
jgi:RNA polymerase sigma-70 factor, ECF subfamily